MRRALEEEGIFQRVPTFTACVKRLEHDGFITSEFVKATDSAHGRERSYNLTAAGRKALRELADFYSRLQRQAKWARVRGEAATKGTNRHSRGGENPPLALSDLGIDKNKAKEPRIFFAVI